MHWGVGLVAQQDSSLETGECKIVYWRQGNARAIGTLFSQALMRKLKNIGLQVAYREDSNVN